LTLRQFTPFSLTDESSWLARRIAAKDVERTGTIPSTLMFGRRSDADLSPRWKHE
jgi:hypothetical protein